MKIEKICFFLLIFSVFIIWPAEVHASSATLSVDGCNASSCSVSEYNTNDTGIAVSLSLGQSDEINWSVPSISDSSQIDDVRLRMRYDGDVNLDGIWNFTFRSMNGQTIYCEKDVAQQSGTDVYLDIDANASCGWSASRIKDFNLTITNNDTGIDGTGSIKFADIYLEYTKPYLDVNLSMPESGITTNVIVNTTFRVNATMICRGADCGNINGTIRYNKTGGEPDTPINITLGGQPFFVNETVPEATKLCSNPVLEGQTCYLEWTINASGNAGSEWKIDVIFNSDSTGISQNDTPNAMISIIPCVIDMTLQWSTISFGALAPNTDQNESPGNWNDSYNITINQNSCPTDLYIRGTNLTNTTLASYIGIGNISWSNTTNIFAEAHPLSEINALIKAAVMPVVNITTWYWINIPPVFAGRYNGTITIMGVKNE